MLWFSLWHFPENYRGPESAFPRFHDRELTSFFDQQAEAIQRELLEFLDTKDATPYFHKRMVSKSEGYKTFSLRWWSIEFFENQKDFPILTQWLRKRPDVLTLSINILEPKTRILPHMGDTNAVIRGHYGITIPEGLPRCGIRVLNEERSWKNQEWLWFTDAHEHETWNESNTRRIVLLMDVLRPEYRKAKGKICATVMASQFIQKRREKWNFIHRMDPRSLKRLARMLLPLVYARILMLNFIKKY